MDADLTAGTRDVDTSDAATKGAASRVIVALKDADR
jgi:hypothetical protein